MNKCTDDCQEHGFKLRKKKSHSELCFGDFQIGFFNENENENGMVPQGQEDWREMEKYQ